MKILIKKTMRARSDQNINGIREVVLAKTLN